MTLIVALKRDFGSVMGADKQIEEDGKIQPVVDSKIRFLGKFKMYGISYEINNDKFREDVEDLVKKNLSGNEILDRTDLKKIKRLELDFKKIANQNRENAIDLLVLDNRGEKHFLQIVSTPLGSKMKDHQYIKPTIFFLGRDKSFATVGLQKACNQAKDYYHKQCQIKDVTNLTSATNIVKDIVMHSIKNVRGVGIGVDIVTIDENNKVSDIPMRPIRHKKGVLLPTEEFKEYFDLFNEHGDRTIDLLIYPLWLRERVPLLHLWYFEFLRCLLKSPNKFGIDKVKKVRIYLFEEGTLSPTERKLTEYSDNLHGIFGADYGSVVECKPLEINRKEGSDLLSPEFRDVIIYLGSENFKKEYLTDFLTHRGVDPLGAFKKFFFNGKKNIDERSLRIYDELIQTWFINKRLNLPDTYCRKVVGLLTWDAEYPRLCQLRKISGGMKLIPIVGKDAFKSGNIKRSSLYFPVYEKDRTMCVFDSLSQIGAKLQKWDDKEVNKYNILLATILKTNYPAYSEGITRTAVLKKASSVLISCGQKRPSEVKCILLGLKEILKEEYNRNKLKKN